MRPYCVQLLNLVAVLQIYRYLTDTLKVPGTTFSTYSRYNTYYRYALIMLLQCTILASII